MSTMQRPAEELAGGEVDQPPPPAAMLRSAAEERRRADDEAGFQLFLGNLGLEVDEAFLSRVFSKFDSFVPGSERVKRDKDGRTKCYGFVAFSRRDNVIAAVEEFNDQYIGSCRVRLSWRANVARTSHLSQAQLRERIEARKRVLQEIILLEQRR